MSNFYVIYPPNGSGGGMAVTTIGTIDSNGAVANGASISGINLFMQSASVTVPGLVNNTTQSFSGNKTFSGSISASNLSGTNAGDVTLSAFGSTPNSNGASLTGQALNLQPADGTNPGGVSIAAQTFAGAKTFNNGIILNAGGAGVPSLYFATDTTSGLFRSASNQIGISILGTKAFNIGSTTCNIYASLGISATASFVPTSTLHTMTSGGSNTSTNESIISNTTSSARFIGQRARGTYGSESALTNSTQILTLGGIGYGATAYSASSMAYIKFIADQNWTDTAQGSKISFGTTLNGTVTPIDQLVIDNTGAAVFTSSVTATSFIGNASSATTATNATNGATVSVSNSASYFPLFAAASANSNQPFNLGTGLTFNPSTNNLSTTTFTGALAGNATTATTATNVSGIVVVANGGTGSATLISNGFDAKNLGLAVSASGNILTAALKQADGATNPGNTPATQVTVGMHSNSMNSGSFVVRNVTGALSFTATQSSSLGVGVNNNQYVYFYVVDTDGVGTMALCASGVRYDDSSPYSGNIIKESYTVTITNASPAVITATGSFTQNNTPVVFTTSGALPTGLTAGQVYYAINASPPNTIQVSATPGGVAINTSSAGSGTHTMHHAGWSMVNSTGATLSGSFSFRCIGRAQFNMTGPGNWNNPSSVDLLTGIPPNSMGETISMKATLSSTQSIPNATDTVVIYDAKSFDTHGILSLVNGNFIVPITGTYRVSAMNDFVGNALGVRQLRTTGYQILAYDGSVSASFSDMLNGSDLIQLQQYSLLSFSVYQTSTGNLNIGSSGANYNYCTFERTGT